MLMWAALAVEAAVGFGVAGVATAMLRSYLNRTRLTAEPVAE